MILTALTRYRGAEEALPYGYARKSNLSFLLVLHPDGTGCLLDELFEVDDRGRPRSPETVVPDIKRSNNPPPMLACDTAAYVLGRPKAVSDPSALAKEAATAAAKQSDFLKLLLEYGAESGDSDVSAYAGWVTQGMPGLEAAVAGLSPHGVRRLDLDLVALSVRGSPQRIHMKPAAQDFWARKAEGLKAGRDSGLCLSCGRLGPVVGTLPQALSGTRIPGTNTSDVALVSANFTAASRGATGTGLKSAPICGTCAGLAVNAFNAMTADRDHTWRLGSQTSAIWWADSDAIDEAIDSLDEPSPAQVARLLDSVLTGREASDDIPGRFYLVTFSGNVGRLVIRRFIDFPLATVSGYIAKWFIDVDTPDPDRRYRRLTAIAQSAGRQVPGDPMAAVPEGAFEALLLTAVANQPPPRALLLPAITRAKAEAHLLGGDGLDGWRIRQRAMDRLALFRVILNRTVYEEGDRIMAGLDEERSDPSYLSGRLFAVRQNLQRKALGEVNASIADRYFARASAHPASVEHALSVLEQQHLRALRRKGREGAFVRLSQQVQTLHDRIGVAPGRLAVEAQAEWIAGYYQQREADIQAAQAAAASQKDRETAARQTEEEN